MRCVTAGATGVLAPQTHPRRLYIPTRILWYQYVNWGYCAAVAVKSTLTTYSYCCIFIPNFMRLTGLAGWPGTSGRMSSELLTGFSGIRGRMSSELVAECAGIDTHRHDKTQLHVGARYLPNEKRPCATDTQ